MSDTRPLVLVADDDPDIRSLVALRLERSGYDVVAAGDGEQALATALERAPDLALIDVMMPKLDGYEVTERLRQQEATRHLPVILLTARVQESDIARGVEAGADDYVTKPFGRQELLARVEAHLRRAGERAEQPGTYADGLLTIDFAQREVTVNGSQVTLTPLEFKLLSTFVRNPNQVLSHEQLLELVWGDALTGSRARTKLYVGYLRQKLSAADDGESPIETVRGFGYRYRPRTA